MSDGARLNGVIRALARGERAMASQRPKCSNMPLALKSWFEKWPHTQGLVDGSVSSDRVTIERQDLSFMAAIRAATREEALDLVEMPISTLVLGRRFGLPYTGLPITICRDFHQRSIVVARTSTIQRPEELSGRRIGVRAYSVTTGVWVRGILQNDHGVDPSQVTWVTTEDSHIREFCDPPNVEMVPGGSLLDMLLDGRIDAAIGLKALDFTKLRYLYPDLHAATASWLARTGVYPINHLIAVKTKLLTENPWLAGELMGMFEQAKTKTMQAGWSARPTFADGSHRDDLTKLVGNDLLPNGHDRNKRAVAMALRFVHQQGLTDRLVRPDEIFA